MIVFDDFIDTCAVRRTQYYRCFEATRVGVGGVVYRCAVSAFGVYSFAVYRRKRLSIYLEAKFAYSIRLNSEEVERVDRLSNRSEFIANIDV